MVNGSLCSSKGGQQGVGVPADCIVPLLMCCETYCIIV